MNIVFTSCFTVETILKLLAYGVRVRINLMSSRVSVAGGAENEVRTWRHGLNISGAPDLVFNVCMRMLVHLVSLLAAGLILQSRRADQRFPLNSA